MGIFLLNTALFFVLFLLVGLLARRVYRRRVVGPLRREVERLLRERDAKEWSEKHYETFRLRGVIQTYMTYIAKYRQTIRDEIGEITRLKANVVHLADQCDDRARALKISRAQIESITVDRANITKDLYAALNRIDDLEARNNHYLTKILALEKRNERIKKNRK